MSAAVTERRVAAAEAVRAARLQRLEAQAEADRARHRMHIAIKAAFAAGLRPADIAIAASCSDKWVYAVLRDAT